MLPIHGTAEIQIHGLNLTQFRSAEKDSSSKIISATTTKNSTSSIHSNCVPVSTYSTSNPTPSPAFSTRQDNTNTLEFMKSESICLSLPGHVIRAEWGSRELILSHSLDHYIASSIAAATTRSRSDRLYLDWTVSVSPDSTIGRISDDSMAPYVDSNGKGHIDGIECRIDQIFGHTVLLKEPYCGPTVEAGFPRVFLRTNLVPVSSNASNNQVSKDSPMTASVDRLIQKLSFHTAVTAIEAHPSLPYVVLGFLDNAVQILSTETYIDNE